MVEYIFFFWGGAGDVITPILQDGDNHVFSGNLWGGGWV